MKWEKSTRYQTSIRVQRRTYQVLCASDFDGGYAVYINKQFVADVESLPTEEELIDIISENMVLENTIKEGYVAAGVFE